MDMDMSLISRFPTEAKKNLDDVSQIYRAALTIWLESVNAILSIIKLRL